MDRLDISHQTDGGSLFVNRYHELEEFKSILGNYKGQFSQSIIYVCGVGGIGKSSLLSRMMYECQVNQVPFASVDFKTTKTPVALSATVREQLNHSFTAKFVFWKFDKRLRLLKRIEQRKILDIEASDTKVSNATKGGLGDLTSSLVGASGAVAGTAIAGPLGGILGAALGSGIGSTFMSLFTGESYPSRIYKRVGREHEGAESLLSSIEEDLLSSFLQGMNIRLRKCGGVLFLDSFEAVSNVSSIKVWLDNYLLEGRFPKRLLVVIAGRGRLPGNWISSPFPVREWLLEPFNDDYAAMLVQQRGITDSKLVKKITTLSSGLPLALSILSASLKVKGPDFLMNIENFDEEVVLNRLLRGLPLEEMEDLTFCVAVLRQFDEDLLSRVAEDTNIKEKIQRLADVSLIQKLPNGCWTLHDSVREFMLRDLKVRRPDRYRIFNARAISVYEDRMRSLMVTDDTWQAYSRERLFHSFAVNPTLAINEMVNYFDLAFAFRWLIFFQNLLDDLRSQDLPSTAKVWLDFNVASLLLKVSGARKAMHAFTKLIELGDLPMELRSRLLLVYSEIQGELEGRWDLSRESALEGASIARTINNKQLAAFCLEMAGRACIALDEPEKTLEYLASCLELTEELGDRREKGRALNFVGVAYFSLREFEKALESYRMAETILLDLNDNYALGILYGDMGSAYFEQNNLDQAERFFYASARRAKAAGEPMSMALADIRLGDNYSMHKNFRKAEIKYKSGLKEFRRLSMLLYQAMSLTKLCKLYYLKNDYILLDAAALQIHRLADKDKSAIKYSIVAHCIQSMTLLDRNMFDDAMNEFHLAVASAIGKSPVLESIILDQLSNIFTHLIEIGKEDIAQMFASTLVPSPLVRITSYLNTSIELINTIEDKQKLREAIASLNNQT